MIKSLDYQLLESANAEYRKKFLYYKPSVKQKAFHEAGKVAIERLFIAGNRTGKTFGGCVEDAMDVTGNYPDDYNGYRCEKAIILCCVAHSGKDIRTILQPLFFGGVINNYQGLIHPSLVKKTVYSNHGVIDYVDILHKSGSLSQIQFMSYEQGVDKFQGKRFHKVHCDEEPPFGVYQELMIRLMDIGDGGGQGRMMLTMTPKYGYTPVVSYFMHRTEVIESESGKEQEEQFINQPEQINKGKYYIHASWQDNPHLSKETKDHMMSNLKPHEIEYVVNGIPCIGEGTVYQIPESIFVVPPREIPDHWARFAGMDIGWVDHTAIVFFAYDRDNATLYVYKEYKVNNQTPQNHAASLIPMGLDWIPTVCDPSCNQRGQTDGITAFTKYHESGLKIIKAKHAKESAIQEIMNRINSGKFKIFNTCRKLLDEWRSYSRDKEGKPMKGNDHLMNALEYGINDGFKYGRTKTEYDTRNNYQHRSSLI